MNFHYPFRPDAFRNNSNGISEHELSSYADQVYLFLGVEDNLPFSCPSKVE